MHPSALGSRFDFKFNFLPLFEEKIMLWESKTKAFNLHVVKYNGINIALKEYCFSSFVLIVWILIFPPFSCIFKQLFILLAFLSANTFRTRQHHGLINSFLALFLRQLNRYLFNCFLEKSLQCKIVAHREGNFSVIVCYQKTATHLKEAKNTSLYFKSMKINYLSGPLLIFRTRKGENWH